MYVELNKDQKDLLAKCREMGQDFANRTGQHDRDASHPHENYNRLRAEGFLSLNIPKKWGGAGIGLFDHTLAYETLAQGCTPQW